MIDFAKYLEDNDIHPDILVNNAGILPKFDRFEHYSMADIEKAMNINFYSAVYSIHTLLPMILKSKTPGIINIDSSASLMSLAGTSVYSASKAALKSLSNHLEKSFAVNAMSALFAPALQRPIYSEVRMLPTQRARRCSMLLAPPATEW